MDNLFTISDLHKIIEALRDELYNISKNKNNTDKEVIGATKMFEKLLSEYVKLIKANYHHK